MLKNFRFLLFLYTGLTCLLVLPGDAFSANTPAEIQPVTVHVSSPDQERLNNVLEWVFTTMEREYYEPISRQTYEEFKRDYTAVKLKAYNAKKQQTEDFIHLGAGLLVNKLRHADDRFSSFVPPQKAQEYKEDAYAERKDLGLEGKRVTDGYELTRVQKHSQAFKEGMRSGDVILQINHESIAGLDEKTIKEKLTPEVDTLTLLQVRLAGSQTVEIELKAESYFLETVHLLDSPSPEIAILKIDQFNRMTGEDFGDLLNALDTRVRELVLDLRDNHGGPPLTTREILGFFTEANDPLFFIVRKNRPPFLLSSPISAAKFKGKITVLVNEKTASAAETLSGVLREKGLAIVAGRQTAGATYLKTMYDYDDGSTMLLLTSKTYFHDQTVFPPHGIVPDVVTPENTDTLQFVLSKRS